MTRIIIDTDIGDDTDDVLALALALNSPELEICGITTAFGHASKRAKIACHMLDVFGRSDIPVHSGVEEPLKGPTEASLEMPPQFLPEMEHWLPASQDAVSFMADTLLTGPLSIICIAPLTNIATLLRDRPDAADNISELIIMGGCYYRHANEWNFACDPEAARIVFESGVPIRAVGLDITTRTGLTREFMTALDLNDAKTRFLFDMCEIWYKLKGYTPILHDPLTLYAAMAGSALRFRHERIRIECEGRETRGFSYCEEHRLWGREAPEPNASVAFDLDTESFINFFVDRVFPSAHRAGAPSA